MTRRFSICQTCHKVVDLDWDAHDGGVDGTGRECWYCPAHCPAEQCNPTCPSCGAVRGRTESRIDRLSCEDVWHDRQPSDADMRRVDL